MHTLDALPCAYAFQAVEHFLVGTGTNTSKGACTQHISLDRPNISIYRPLFFRAANKLNNSDSLEPIRDRCQTSAAAARRCGHSYSCQAYPNALAILFRRSTCCSTASQVAILQALSPLRISRGRDRSESPGTSMLLHRSAVPHLTEIDTDYPTPCREPGAAKAWNSSGTVGPGIWSTAFRAFRLLCQKPVWTLL